MDALIRRNTSIAGSKANPAYFIQFALLALGGPLLLIAGVIAATMSDDLILGLMMIALGVAICAFAFTYLRWLRGARRP
ncbi:MAG: hypothetical protein AB7O04_06405 [Hyphomonadaceae bacterium]